MTIAEANQLVGAVLGATVAIVIAFVIKQANANYED